MLSYLTVIKRDDSTNKSSLRAVTNTTGIDMVKVKKSYYQHLTRFGINHQPKAALYKPLYKTSEGSITISSINRKVINKVYNNNTHCTINTKLDILCKTAKTMKLGENADGISNIKCICNFAKYLSDN